MIQNNLSSSVSNRIIFSLFANRYDSMLSCWRENPADRPSFDELEATLSEMLLNFHRDNDDDVREVP